MKVTIFGSGTAVPTQDRYPSSYLVEEADTKILLDCGSLTLARLLEHGVGFQDIAAVCLTHFHPDHFAHLLPLVQARFVDDLYEDRTHRDLGIFAPHTFGERWQKLREVFWPEPQELYPLRIQEGHVTASVAAMTITSFPVQHVPWFPSVGYRLEVAGKTLVYTGDFRSGQANETFSAMTDPDVLIIEAAAATPSPSHLTAAQAVAVGQRVGAKQIVLTHLRDSIIDLAQAEVDKQPELVRLAQDGLTLEI